MGKENAPAVTDEFVEFDVTFSGTGLEVWGNAPETKAESNDHHS